MTIISKQIVLGVSSSTNYFIDVPSRQATLAQARCFGCASVRDESSTPAAVSSEGRQMPYYHNIWPVPVPRRCRLITRIVCLPPGSRIQFFRGCFAINDRFFWSPLLLERSRRQAIYSFYILYVRDSFRFKMMMLLIMEPV